MVLDRVRLGGRRRAVRVADRRAVAVLAVAAVGRAVRGQVVAVRVVGVARDVVRVGDVDDEPRRVGRWYSSGSTQSGRGSPKKVRKMARNM